jgi:hypothetical protein
MNEPLEPRLPALERLALSRERIRQSLHEAAEPPPSMGEPSVLVTALLAIPGVGIVVDAVRRWWADHPLHFAGTLAANTARGMVRPMARRSPYRLVLAALVVGGLLYWVRPWRGLLKPALLAGLLPHLVSRAVAHVPMESWLATLMSMGTARADPDMTPEGAAAVAEAAAQAANVAAASATGEAQTGVTSPQKPMPPPPAAAPGARPDVTRDTAAVAAARPSVLH